MLTFKQIVNEKLVSAKKWRMIYGIIAVLFIIFLIVAQLGLCSFLQKQFGWVILGAILFSVITACYCSKIVTLNLLLQSETHISDETSETSAEK